MFRPSLLRSSARAGVIFRHTPSRFGNAIPQRGLAWLTADNEFLPKLLAKDGLLKYAKVAKGLKPEEVKAIDTSPATENVEENVESTYKVETKKSDDGNQYLLFKFTVDRNNAVIKSTVSVFETPTEQQDDLKNTFIIYPPYSPDAQPPSLHEPIFSDPRKDKRVAEVAHNLWRSFCTNDFLFLTVAATMHADESVSIRWCTAQVDESAVLRQSELFKHVHRTELPDELQAEKSLLVYRKFPEGNVGTIGTFPSPVLF